MDETYKIRLSNGYFDFQRKYCSIKIEANDLDTFVKLVKHCKQLEEFKNEDNSG